MTRQVATANRLGDGVVVYLAPNGRWSERIDVSRIAEGNGEGEKLLAAAMPSVAARIVVEPYLIEVTGEVGAITPTRYREVIRASGPTNRRDLGKQAEPR